MKATEEDDYMSDAFLVESTSVRPGLRSTTQRKRDRAVEGGEGARREKKTKKRRANDQDAQERMQHGLATPISASNKGFSLLQKMGYQTGMGLGKTGMPVWYFATYIKFAKAYTVYFSRPCMRPQFSQYTHTLILTVSGLWVRSYSPTRKEHDTQS